LQSSKISTRRLENAELTDAVDYSQPSVSKAVDVLAANDLVAERRDGNTRTVHINRDRSSRP
jgi:DNA-binding transcriptional ArsR family regulator